MTSIDQSEASAAIRGETNKQESNGVEKCSFFLSLTLNTVWCKLLAYCKLFLKKIAIRYEDICFGRNMKPISALFLQLTAAAPQLDFRELY